MPIYEYKCKKGQNHLPDQNNELPAASGGD